MTKKPKTNKTERVWKRMHGFALAEKKEWERLIENPELIKEVQNLRDCYGLPLPECKDLIQSYRDYYAWMEVSKPMVVKNKNGQLVLAEHMLRFERFSRDKEKLETQFNIPKKFQSNLHNWICWGNTCPLGFSTGLGTPPQQKPFRNNPHKDDWRPVWEWEKRHPDITRPQIAQMMGLSRSVVHRHLKEIDNETEDWLPKIE